jgi:hypothetical protein
MYVRRSLVYRKIRSRKLAEGHYIVENEATGAGYYVFRRPEHADWAIVGRDKPLLKAGFRKKDDAMHLLEAAQVLELAS